jgi:cytochrome P450
LADHPDQRREIVDDISLLPGAIEEVLRYEAPSPVQARYVARDVECRGQTIAEGSIMLFLNGSANRDERQFPRGESFDIHRRMVISASVKAFISAWVRRWRGCRPAWRSKRS